MSACDIDRTGTHQGPFDPPRERRPRTLAQGGNALAETVIVLPVFLLVLASAVQLGELVLVRLQLHGLLRAVAREAAEHSHTAAQAGETLRALRPLVAPRLRQERLALHVGPGDAPTVPSAAAAPSGGGATSYGFEVALTYRLEAAPLYRAVFGRDALLVRARVHTYGNSWNFDLGSLSRGAREEAGE